MPWARAVLDNAPKSWSFAGHEVLSRESVVLDVADSQLFKALESIIQGSLKQLVLGRWKAYYDYLAAADSRQLPLTEVFDRLIDIFGCDGGSIVWSLRSLIEVEMSSILDHLASQDDLLSQSLHSYGTKVTDLLISGSSIMMFHIPTLDYLEDVLKEIELSTEHLPKEIRRWKTTHHMSLWWRPERLCTSSYAQHQLILLLKEQEKLAASHGYLWLMVRQGASLKSRDGAYGNNQVWIQFNDEDHISLEYAFGRSIQHI